MASYFVLVEPDSEQHSLVGIHKESLEKHLYSQACLFFIFLRSLPLTSCDKALASLLDGESCIIQSLQLNQPTDNQTLEIEPSS